MIKSGSMITINGKTLKRVAKEKRCGYTTIQQFHKRFGEAATIKYEKREYSTQGYVTEIVRRACYPKEVLCEYATPWRTGNGWSQRFDVFIPCLNLAIEYNGIQHYEPVEYFGGKAMFYKIRARDSLKKEMCKKNGIRLVEIKYDELKYDESDVEFVKNLIYKEL